MSFVVDLTTATQEAARDVGQRMADYSYTLCPERTGKLKRSFFKRPTADGYSFGYTAEHAAIVEEGTAGGVQQVRAHTRAAHSRRTPTGATTTIRAHGVRSYRRTMPPQPGHHFIQQAVNLFVAQLPATIAVRARRLAR